MTSPAHVKRRKRFLRSGLLGATVSGLAAWWIVKQVEAEAIVDQLRQVRVPYLLAGLALTVLSYVIRSWRWKYFFKSRPPTLYDSFRCVITGFFMNNVLPARLGEFVRAHLGGKVTRQSRTVVLATIAGERLADGLTISVIFATLFTLGASAQELNEGRELFYVAYGFAGVTLATAILLYFRQSVFHFLEKLRDKLPGHHLSHFTLIRIHRFIEGLEPIFYPSRLAIISALSLFIWFVELAVYFMVTHAFGQEMSVGSLSLFLAAVNFSSLIPAAPGGIGVIEAFTTAALVHIGITPEAALAMVASQHIIQILVVGFPGLFFFLHGMSGKLPLVNDEIQEVDSVKSDNAQTLRKSAITPLEPEDANFSAPGARLSSDISLSVIIPAYNEESRLPKTLGNVIDFLERRGGSFEIIVVDDGSVDATVEVAKQFQSRSTNTRILRCDRNYGKGHAVRLGVLDAKGLTILVTDADGAAPIEEIVRLENALKVGAHVAIGSRALVNKDTRISTVWYRKLLGRVFAKIVNFVILPGIADTQCGFKLFRRGVARYLFSRQKSDGFSFDVEILFLARCAGCTISEIAINWENIPGSKVNLLSDSLQMLGDVLTFRLREALGVYHVTKVFTNQEI